LDLPLFERTLSHVRDHGTLPPDTSSKEDQNSVGESGVSEAEVEQFREQVQEWFDGLTRRAGGQKGSRTEIRICVLEGFLLFPPPPPSEAKPTTTTTTTTPNDLSSTSASQLAELYQLSRTLLSSRLFLPLQREQMLARRLARSGYVTLEGFWADPPGYVEDVVWPNYARDHAWMYADGDVDRGIFKDQVDGVDVCPGRGTWTLKQCLAWAVAQVRAAVEEKVVGSGR
jgi:nicotinamide/nicotinate riboside kinase